MIYLLFFITELLILYLLSRAFILDFSKLSHKLHINPQISIYFIAFLFLPGTFIHELSHFLFAILLRVRVLSFNLIPRVETDRIILGSVGLTSSDIFRSFLIGIAPFITGNIILFTLFHFYLNKTFQLNITSSIIFFYLIFNISNTMFASKKDLEGALKLMFLIIIFLSIYLLLGLPIPNFLQPHNLVNMDIKAPLAEAAAHTLIFPILIDFSLILGLKLINSLLKTPID